MSCYYPVKGYRSADVSRSTGKRGIVFSPLKGFRDLPMEVPCGRCIGCRLDRAKEWAVRCVQEASLHKENCFITLTYNDKSIPPNGSLRPTDLVKFMKLLRKRVGVKIRFFQCGEYGERLERPHHHVLIFGWMPQDMVLWKNTEKYKLWRSPIIESIWKHGFSTVGNVNYETASYVSRYILKKVTGDKAEAHYGDKVPEYLTMSRRPGIGREWIEKYHDEVYKEDTLVYGLGKLTKPPRYYDKVYKQIDAEHLEECQSERRIAEANSDYNSPYRLKVREKVAEARVKMLERQIH